HKASTTRARLRASSLRATSHRATRLSGSTRSYAIRTSSACPLDIASASATSPAQSITPPARKGLVRGAIEGLVRMCLIAASPGRDLEIVVLMEPPHVVALRDVAFRRDDNTDATLRVV